MTTNNNSKNLMLEHVIRDRIDVEKIGLTLVGKEYTTALGRIDILTTDETGGYVPIEIKLGEATDNAIGQIMGYMKAVDAVRGIIIAECFSDRVKAISADINVELMPYCLEVFVGGESVAYTDDVIEEYKTIVDPVKAFILDVVEITNDPDDYVSFETFFRGYVSYCQMHGIISLPKKKLNKSLRQNHGFVDNKGHDANTGRYVRRWIGIRLGAL